jgi:ribosome-binding factor A
MSKHHRKRGAHASRTHASHLPEDAFVDPAVYFSDTQESPARQRKTEQLRAAIRHAIGVALECDVDDPLLESLHLHDVVAEPNGAFIALLATSSLQPIDHVQARLRDAAPVFRNALANSLTRKRVPSVTFFVIPAPAIEVDDE